MYFLRGLLWKIASKKIYYITCASDETKNDLIKLNIFEKEKIITLHDPIIFISEIIKLKKEKISKFMEKENIFLIPIGWIVPGTLPVLMELRRFWVDY